jgi:hypothetical protein
MDKMKIRQEQRKDEPEGKILERLEADALVDNS